MIYFMDILHIIFPLFSVILLLAGLKTGHKKFIVIALWLSLIAMILHYQTAGGEILGSYFNYLHAFIYSMNVLILLASVVFLLFDMVKAQEKSSIRYLAGLVAACSIIGSLLLLGNLWINARFIEDRMPGTPVLQVATFKKLAYCDYQYVFYKVSPDGTLNFMCPNYYGLLPIVGELAVAPDYVFKQLPPALQLKFQPQIKAGS